MRIRDAVERVLTGLVGTNSASFLGELVEEGVLAIVGRPDGKIMAQGDAALGSFPKEFCIGMFGEFVEADIAAVNGHGLGVGGESDDPGAVVEFDHAGFDLLDDTGGMAMLIKLIDGQILWAVAEDAAGELENFGELVALIDVFERAGIIFGGKEIIPIFEPEPFADVFESVGIGPADADGFFGQSHGLFALLVNGFFGLDPGDLVRHEMFGERAVGVDVIAF